MAAVATSTYAVVPPYPATGLRYTSSAAAFPAIRRPGTIAVSPNSERQSDKKPEVHERRGRTAR